MIPRGDGTALGSARVPRAGCGASPQQAFEQWCLQEKVRDGEDAIASPRDACATQKLLPHVVEISS